MASSAEFIAQFDVPKTLREIDNSLGSIAARKLMYANKMGHGRTVRMLDEAAGCRRLPTTETNLESDHASGDGRFQLPHMRLSPSNPLKQLSFPLNRLSFPLNSLSDEEEGEGLLSEI
jgi:hypothetical protein